MASTYPHQIEGARARKSVDGLEFTRVITVTGITSAGDQQFLDAMNAPNVGKLGDAHPKYPGCRLEEIVPEAQGGGNFKLYEIYRGGAQIDDPEDQVIEVGTTLQMVSTNKDRDGTLVVVTYGGPEASSDQYSQSPRMSVLRPHSTIRAERTESSSPGAKSQAYAGKVNGPNQFSLAGSAAARTWLCTAIVGRSYDGGETYRVSYDFEYAPTHTDEFGETVGGWDQESYWLDPETGRPPTTFCVDPEVYPLAKVIVKVYDEANFNNLNLT